ncbi:hypothetical protein ACQKFS_06080 [Pseudomonas guineae]
MNAGEWVVWISTRNHGRASVAKPSGSFRAAGAEVVMTLCRSLVSLAAVLLVSPLYAEPKTPQTLRVIPKTTISPGASGSIGSSQTIDNHNLYGGQRLPEGLQRHEQRYGSQSLENRGTIKQTIEYPNGYRVQQYPGQRTEYDERSR